MIPAAAADNSGLRKSSVRSLRVRVSAFQGGGASGSAAGRGTSQIAAIQPAIANPIRTMAVGNASTQLGINCMLASAPTTIPLGAAVLAMGVLSANQLPPAIPISVAASVTVAKRPFALESLAAGTVSGIEPTRLGARIAAWQPITIKLLSKSQSPTGRLANVPPEQTPHTTVPTAPVAITISANLHQMITVRLG